MPHLYIIRGLPGSGKSTKAKEILDWEKYHYEADMFFTSGKEYKFNSLLLGAAHDWCYSNTVRSLSLNFDVVVSNTFTKLWELERYLAIPGLLPDVTVSVIEMKTQYESIHNIPEEKFNQMVARWEEIPDVWNIDTVRIW